MWRVALASFILLLLGIAPLPIVADVFPLPNVGCDIYDNITTGWDSESEIIGGDNISLQSVQASENYDMNYVCLLVYAANSPTTLEVEIYNENITTFVPEGAALASGQYDVSAVTTDNYGEWIAVELDATVSLISGQSYDLVVRQDEPAPDNIIWLTTTTDGPGGFYAYSTDNGANWTYDNVTFRDAMFEFRYCSYADLGAPMNLHVIDISATSVTLAWQEAELSPSSYYRTVYRTDNFASDPFGGTLVEAMDNTTSVTATDLLPGTTYYFSVWGHNGAGLYSVDAGYVACTTYAGYGDIDYGPDISGGENATILANSPMGGIIDFVSSYGQLPSGTVGILGYSAMFIFVLVGVASYNRSTMLVIILSVVGLALGYTLGVYSFVFLIIAIIIGMSIGVLRGGQPTGG